MGVTLVFAEPIAPEGARTGHNTHEIFGGPKPYAAPSVYIQTTDANGFVFRFATPTWRSETECELSGFDGEPFAIQATCRVKGFGQVMCRADAEGKLYDPSGWRDGERILFDLEAARSRLAW